MGLARVHRATQQAIADSDLPTVLLRNGWYTESHTAALPEAIARGTRVGCGRVACATRADLAEAAAVALTRERQPAEAYDLTGETTWSMAEPAAKGTAQCRAPLQWAAVCAALSPYRVQLTVAAPRIHGLTGSRSPRSPWSESPRAPQDASSANSTAGSRRSRTSCSGGVI